MGFSMGKSRTDDGDRGMERIHTTTPQDDAILRRPGCRARDRRSAAAAAAVAAALVDCPSLKSPSFERDALWLAVQGHVCTKSVAYVVPLGSSSAVAVDRGYAGDELVAAMSWLLEHEEEARTLSPLKLFIRLRGEATRGRLGSARRAQADALHGMTEVPPGRPVRFLALDADEAVS